jgi:hypothetical protein
MACSVLLYTDQKHMSHLRRGIKVNSEVKGKNDEQCHMHEHNYSSSSIKVGMQVQYSVDVCGPRYTGLAFCGQPL